MLARRVAVAEIYFFFEQLVPGCFFGNRLESWLVHVQIRRFSSQKVPKSPEKSRKCRIRVPLTLRVGFEAIPAARRFLGSFSSVGFGSSSLATSCLSGSAWSRLKKRFLFMHSPNIDFGILGA